MHKIAFSLFTLVVPEDIYCMLVCIPMSHDNSCTSTEEAQLWGPRTVVPRAGVGLGFLRLPSVKKNMLHRTRTHCSSVLASVGLEPPNRPTLTVLAVHRTVRKNRRLHEKQFLTELLWLLSKPECFSECSKSSCYSCNRGKYFSSNLKSFPTWLKTLPKTSWKFLKTKYSIICTSNWHYTIWYYQFSMF